MRGRAVFPGAMPLYGPKGDPGANGRGVPPAGNAGDLLVKNSATDYDTVWTDTPTVDALRFDQTAAEISEVAKLAWNATDGTLEFGLTGGNVTLQIGQESVQRIVNKSGSILSDGMVVRVIGAQGNRVAVDTAIATNDSLSATTIGMMTETVANNQQGFMTTAGLVRDLNTAAYPEGTALWLSPTVAGGVTTVKPTAPHHLVLVGFVVRSQSQNGSIFVHVVNGFEIEELHDVLIVGKVDKQILAYDAAVGVWKNERISAMFPPASITPTINGQMEFQLTSNTQLTIKVKGSDGVVRSANLTLS